MYAYLEILLPRGTGFHPYEWIYELGPYAQCEVYSTQPSEHQIY